jgi:hypothetical protein
MWTDGVRVRPFLFGVGHLALQEAHEVSRLMVQFYSLDACLCFCYDIALAPFASGNRCTVCTPLSIHPFKSLFGEPSATRQSFCRSPLLSVCTFVPLSTARAL